MKRVTLGVLCEIKGDPETFRHHFDNWMRTHACADDPLFELNRSVLSIDILDVCEVENPDEVS